MTYSDSERVCRSGEKSVLERGITCSNRQVRSGKSGCSVTSSLLQLVDPGTKTQQQIETLIGPQLVKPVSKSRYFEDGNSGDHSVVLAKRRVGYVSGL